jgi:hypothetical protein
MAHSPPNYPISVLGSAGGAVDPTTITPDKDGNYVSRENRSSIHMSMPANLNHSRLLCITTASRLVAWLDPSTACLLGYSHTLGCNCNCCFPAVAFEKCARELTDESRFVEFMAEMKRPNDFLKAYVLPTDFSIVVILKMTSLVCGEHSSSFVQSISYTVHMSTIGKCIIEQNHDLRYVLIICLTKLGKDSKYQILSGSFDDIH